MSLVKICLKDKADLKGIQARLEYPVHVLGAMERPKFETGEIELLSVKHSKVGKTTLERYPNLKHVVVRGHGMDHVDYNACEKLGIGVHSLCQYSKSCAMWCVDKCVMGPVMIYGGGNIGSVVFNCVLASGFEAAVSTRQKFLDPIGYKTVVSCIPYDTRRHALNRDFFNIRIFAQLEGADFISISRPQTHSNRDLLDAINNGYIRRAHIDTLGVDLKDELIGTGKVECYDHTAWSYIKMPDGSTQWMLDQKIRELGYP